MALTEQPAEWKFVVPLPEAGDTQTKLSQRWTLDLKEPLSYGKQEFPLTAPLNVTVTARRTPEGADISVEIATEAATECRRCCAPLTVAIQEEFMYSYVLQPDAAKGSDEEEFGDLDKVVIPVAWLGANVDVTSLVWECLVVSLPVYAACPDGCAGADSFLPPEDRTDPRLRALADLLEKEEHKGGK